jgi:PAS domain S-box-containing protein
MRMLNRTVYGLFATIFLLIAVSGCHKNNESLYGELLGFESFRDVPGVTSDEIAAIEAFQIEYDSFVFGMNPTTEAFIDCIENEIKGFSTLFCEWLTGLFGIPFKVSLYSWGDLMAGLESGEIDFTGDLMATEERLKIYDMTEAITERSLRAFRIVGRPPLATIARSRPPCFAFLANSAVFAPVAEIAEYPFEYVFVNDFPTAYDLLESGEADAFLVMGISEAAFDDYDDITSEIFLPLVYNSASMSTQKHNLSPVISVVQKALQSDVMRNHLTVLYEAGHNEYRRHKLFMQLTEDELEYIQNNPVVEFLAEIDNYPISFYNTHENMWQGVALDVLREVGNFTGLTFKIANGTDVNWSIILGMLENGEGAMISELVRTNERIGRFLWSDKAIMEDHAALLSKLSYHNIDLNEIANIKVGVIRNTVYAELFKRWFPNHPFLVEYNGMDDVLNALERGDIDMIMGRTYYYLHITNYREILDYKINVIFNNYLETVFGFNKNETVLCSIINKALRLIDTESISMNWMYKGYDYRYKLIETQRPWLIGAIGMSLCVLALIFILLQRNRHYGRQLENQVHIRTAEMKAVIDNYKGVIWSVDAENNITTFGGQYLEKLGLLSSFLIGKNLTTTRLINEHLDINDYVEKTFHEGAQNWISEADGSMFYSSTTPVYDISGNVMGVVGSSDDVTELITLQKNLEAAVKEAQTANKAKSVFVANMSHEMRTPMNVVVGLTDLMLEDDIPSEIRENLEKINLAGSTLMGIINDILDISKIEAGKLELMPVQYEAASLLNDVIAMNIIRIGEKPITFILDIDENLPQILLGDDLRVKQIINNLLSNAFKYTQKGTVTMGVGFARDGDADVWLSLYVKDTGIGIHDRDIGKLFSDYYQVDAKANRKVEGTGLGLSITKRLVELMDGEIFVESEYGKGTLFHLRIRQGFVTSMPLGMETVKNLRSFKYSEKQKSVNEKLVRPDLSYARVLVVDDMQTNLDVVANLLRKYKMQVDCVTNGQDAINLIAAGEPVYNAIFMDHMMPEMDGIEATFNIRAIGTEYANSVPIIALTANATVGNEKMFLENSFQAFLAKPMNIRDLDSAIRTWVQKTSD